MSKTDKILLTIAACVFVAGSAFVYVLFTNPALLNGRQNSSLSASFEPAEVVYDEKNGFVPQKMTVYIGQTVVFKNNRTSQPMYIASDPHPKHTDYPEFETMLVLKGAYPQVGEDFTFTFKKQGTWAYHDHADPTKTGTIIVK